MNKEVYLPSLEPSAVWHDSDCQGARGQYWNTLDAKSSQAGYGDPMPRGQLSQIMRGIVAPDYIEPSVYCCGPEPFMQSVRDIIRKASVQSAATRFQQKSGANEQRQHE